MFIRTVQALALMLGFLMLSVIPASLGAVALTTGAWPVCVPMFGAALMVAGFGVVLARESLNP